MHVCCEWTKRHSVQCFSFGGGVRSRGPMSLRTDPQPQVGLLTRLPQLPHVQLHSSVPLWSHVASLIFIFLMLILVIVGSGFHVRQAWVGYGPPPVNERTTKQTNETPTAPTGNERSTEQTNEPPTGNERSTDQMTTANKRTTETPTNTTTNQTQVLKSLRSVHESVRYVCGVPASQFYHASTWKDNGNLCAFQDAEMDLDATSLWGYYGYASVSRWGKVTGFKVQGAVIAAILLAFAFKTSILLIDLKELGIAVDPGGPTSFMQPQRALPHILLAGVMFLIFCVEAIFYKCGAYPSQKLAEFDELILKMRSAGQLSLDVRPEDKVCECWVHGYGGATYLALMVGGLACLDTYLIRRASKSASTDDDAPRDEGQGVEAGTGGSAKGSRKGSAKKIGKRDNTPSVDEGSVTTDQMQEHGKPDNIEVVSEDKDTEPELIPGEQHIKIEGGRSGQIVIHNVAHLVKCKNLAEPQAREARKPIKKDQSGGMSDSRKKEMVYTYLNEHGGSVVDHARKGYYTRIKPGEL